MHLEHRPAAIQFPFSGNALGPPVAALGYHLDFGKIGLNLVSVAHIHRGMNSDRQGRRQIDGDVAGRSLQNGVAEAAVGGDKLRGNAATAGFSARALAQVHEFNAAATALGAHRSVGQSQVDAAAAGVHVRGPVNLSQINAAAARGCLDPPLAAFYLDAAATGFQERALQAVQNDHAAAARLRPDFAFGGSYANAAA